MEARYVGSAKVIGAYLLAVVTAFDEARSWTLVLPPDDCLLVSQVQRDDRSLCSQVISERHGWSRGGPGIKQCNIHHSNSLCPRPPASAAPSRVSLCCFSFFISSSRPFYP